MTGGRAVNVVDDPVGVRVLPCQKACARRRAERCGHKGITEQCTLFADAVNVGRLDERMPDNAQFIPAQIVYQDEDDVGRELLASPEGRWLIPDNGRVNNKESRNTGRNGAARRCWRGKRFGGVRLSRSELHIGHLTALSKLLRQTHTPN